MTGMCSPFPDHPECLHPSTHTSFPSAGNAYFHNAASAVRMGLTLEDVSEPRTVAIEVPPPPHYPGPSLRPLSQASGPPASLWSSLQLCHNCWVWVLTGSIWGPGNPSSPHLKKKKKSDWPKDMTSKLPKPQSKSWLDAATVERKADSVSRLASPASHPTPTNRGLEGAGIHRRAVVTRDTWAPEELG